jgi:FKBP-type peptidyl-prolyl cis-trans isomerase FklB
MRNVCFACVLSFAALTALSVMADEKAKQAESGPKMETPLQKATYGIGFDIGTDLKRQGLEIDTRLLLAGITAALEGKDSALTPEELQEAFAVVSKELVAKKAAAAAKFLEDNGKKKGVKVTESGLQYLVIKEGTGETPTDSSTVTAHYRGTLTNGDMFDQSYVGDAPEVEEEPRSFPVTGVIAGWTEALKLMKVGSHYRLFIPSNLAYGERGRPSIPPNSVLIFDLYLVKSEG